MKLLNLETNERKNLSLWMMFGGALVFTVYAIVGLFLVHTQPHFVFWLAVAAHLQIFSIMCGYIAQLVKRRISAGKDGISIADEGTGDALPIPSSGDSNVQP
jgi:membrane protein YdbS with pleckstrin-like domain